jgi:hypothetical protein
VLLYSYTRRSHAEPSTFVLVCRTGEAVPIVGMPLQITGALRGFNTGLLWVLMFSFEIALGVWLLASGGRDR